MKEYRYGYAEIARASLRSAGAVRVDVQRKRFNPDDLADVAVYIVKHRLDCAVAERKGK